VVNTSSPTIPAAGAIAPGPFGHPLLGSTPALRRAPLRTLTESWCEYGDVVRFRLGGPFIGHLLVHPDAVKIVLQENHTNYSKVPWYNDKFKSLIGEGLFTSEGSVWLRQRRLAQPAFHRQRLAALGTIMTDAAEELLQQWEPLTDTGRQIDVRAEMMRLAMTVVARALLGGDVSREAETIGHAIDIAIDYTFQRIQSYFDLPGRFPLPSTRRFERARAELDTIVYRIIAERRADAGDRGDLLSMLLAARDADTGEGMSDTQVHDEVMTIFLAGHETTAVALTWAWYILSRHPQVAERLRAELREVLGGRAPTVEDLPALKYTEMVMQETLRLYPPAWLMTRMGRDDDEIMGYHIPARTPIYLCQYLTHRHPAFWDNPEGVDPERFSPERSVDRPRWAYFPFGGGPRQCIGSAFALMEAQLALATIAQHCRLDLVPGQRIVLDPKITLRPRYGLLMTLRSGPTTAPS
jgi:cytochrome P450